MTNDEFENRVEKTRAAILTKLQRLHGPNCSQLELSQFLLTEIAILHVLLTGVMKFVIPTVVEARNDKIESASVPGTERNETDIPKTPDSLI